MKKRTDLTSENMTEFERLVAEADKQGFSGWDFSWLAGRLQQDAPPWSYEQRVRDAISDTDSLVDLGTGGGERLAKLAPLPDDTYATEAYAPNLPIAKARLGPLGVRVVGIDDHCSLPFPDCRFDTVINRHEALSAAEVARILKPGGRFLTQQVGERNNSELTEWLGGRSVDFGVTLEGICSQLETAGMEISDRCEDFPSAEFRDIGAVVYYLKAVPWQVIDFRVDDYRDRLIAMHNHIQRRGRFVATSHRFLVEAVKR